MRRSLRSTLLSSLFVLVLAVVVSGGVLVQRSVSTNASGPAVGTKEVFPPPWCTWGANEEFHLLHGYYVPWTTNSTAYQWPDRARQFGWQVHIKAVNGDIVAMQPWVQGAYASGHVAVVVKVYSNGSVDASTTAWGSNFWVRHIIHIYQGHGILFIHR
jgi:N-acetylmuramoyl-L-alanine amidase